MHKYVFCQLDQSLWNSNKTKWYIYEHDLDFAESSIDLASDRMESFVNLVLLGGMAAVTLMSTSADADVTCYSCNVTGCGDPFDTSTAYDRCTGESCIKAKGTVFGRMMTEACVDSTRL